MRPINLLPAPLRPRHDGWTPARQWEFLQALGDTASPTRAAARVGMSVQSAYALRRHPAGQDFRAGWEAMVAESFRRLEETAMERAVNGEVETYERGGEVITRTRPCSPRLMSHLLDRSDRNRNGDQKLNAIEAHNIRMTRIKVIQEAIVKTARVQDAYLDNPVGEQPMTIDEAIEEAQLAFEAATGETQALRALHERAARFPDHSETLLPGVSHDDQKRLKP